MASKSSGTWIILLLIAAAAVFIVTANEANYGYLGSSREKIRQGAQAVSDFVSELNPSQSSRPASQIKKPAASPDSAKKHNKDQLGSKDRAELKELLDKVGE